MFASDLIVRVVGNGTFLLTEPLIYEHPKYRITVYPGFDFDGASKPVASYSIFGCPIGGEDSRAACIHDALYASKIFDRYTCDRIFFRAMLEDSVDLAKARLMYRTVRAFGESHYDDSPDISKYRDFISIELIE